MAALNIETDYAFKFIQISNLMGETLQNQVFTEGDVIDTKNLTKGIYFIQLIDSQGHYASKKS